MNRTVFCQKLKQDKEGLNRPPFPGTLGEEIYNNISKEAWQQWLSHQTLLINEYRLNLLDEKSQAFLKEEMQKFLFGQGSEKPAGYQAPE